MPKNNWYVITGGPSTGKTSLLNELEKLGHKVIPEAARTLIDESITKGITPQELRSDEKRFQEDIARLKKDFEAQHDLNALTFFDRGMHDTLAYMRHYGFDIEQWIKELMHKSSYQKVFLLEPLPTYHQDYARTEDSNFIQNIQKLLYDTYIEFGMQPIRVPVASIEERVKFILDNTKVEQKV